jgi:hypothetical protein
VARNLSPDKRRIRDNFLRISQGGAERDSLNKSQGTRIICQIKVLVCNLHPAIKQQGHNIW